MTRVAMLETGYGHGAFTIPTLEFSTTVCLLWVQQTFTRIVFAEVTWASADYHASGLFV